MRSDFNDYARTFYHLCTPLSVLYYTHLAINIHNATFLVYITNMLLSSAPSVVNNSDVMSLSDWLLLSHLPILTTATSSFRVSWCPVHISAAAV